MKTLLTVDWDAFIPEPLDADMNHAESLLYRNMLWCSSSREWLQDVMHLSDYAKDFWDRINLPGQRFVSDTHLVGAELIDAFNIRKVVMVDQHHDLWPWTRESADIHCGNWLTYACTMLGVDEVDWFAPKFSHCIPQEGEPEAEALRKFCDREGVELRLFGMDELDKHLETRPDIVHTCRSSCWTPPWLDNAWREWVSPLQPFAVMDMADPDWNPLDVRQGPVTAPIEAEYLQKVFPDREQRIAEAKKRAWNWIEKCGEHSEFLATIDPAKR